MPFELAEIVRPTVVGLLIQQFINQPLPIITFSGTRTNDFKYS